MTCRKFEKMTTLIKNYIHKPTQTGLVDIAILYADELSSLSKEMAEILVSQIIEPQVLAE